MEANAINAHFFSGLSGLQLPVPKYLFPTEYQDSSRLTYYATFFNSIEINSTFYKLPLEKTMAKWALSVPENFRFTFKLWKEITHSKYLSFKEEDVKTFFKIISGVGDKKGSVLIQFPPGLDKIHMKQLEILLKCIKENNIEYGWSIAIEFRNKSWYNEEVFDLLEAYNISLVIQDMPKSATPLINHNCDFIYLRFHGPNGNYRDSYDEGFLSEYSFFIKEWLEEGKTVYVYFNNTMGDAFKDLQVLNKLMLY